MRNSFPIGIYLALLQSVLSGIIFPFIVKFLVYRISDLYGNFTFTHDWSIGTSTCNNTVILGGPQYPTAYSVGTKTYSTLPTHNTVYFELEFWILGSWESENLMLQLQNMTIEVHSIVPKESYVSLCEYNPLLKSQIIIIQGYLFHSEDTLSITVSSTLDEKIAYNEDWAIRHLNLVFFDRRLSLEDESYCLLSVRDRPGKCQCPAGQYLDNGICKPCTPCCKTCYGDRKSVV